jgi:hypothetical protein
MIPPSKSSAVQSLRPGAQFVMADGVIVRWDSPNLQQPTAQEIETELQRLLSRAHIPAEVSMRQARMALEAVGMLESVEEAMDALPPGPQKRLARIEWEYATSLRRDHPLVAQLQAALALTDEQVDELFVAAGGL